MKLHPPHVTDWSILARMRRIGLVPGESFDAEPLAAVERALERAAADARRRCTAELPTLGALVNGWQMNTDTMGVYGNYYLQARRAWRWSGSAPTRRRTRSTR